MKTYTIRPLEWQRGWRNAVIARTMVSDIQYFVEEMMTGRFKVVFDNGSSFKTIHVRVATIAAAKELAWQDWLRRITPALEEIK